MNISHLFMLTVLVNSMFFFIWFGFLYTGQQCFSQVRGFSIRLHVVPKSHILAHLFEWLCLWCQLASILYEYITSVYVVE